MILILCEVISNSLNKRLHSQFVNLFIMISFYLRTAIHFICHTIFEYYRSLLFGLVNKIDYYVLSLRMNLVARMFRKQSRRIVARCTYVSVNHSKVLPIRMWMHATTANDGGGSHCRSYFMI